MRFAMEKNHSSSTYSHKGPKLARLTTEMSKVRNSLTCTPWTLLLSLKMQSTRGSWRIIKQSKCGSKPCRIIAFSAGTSHQKAISEISYRQNTKTIKESSTMSITINNTPERSLRRNSRNPQRASHSLLFGQNLTTVSFVFQIVSAVRQVILRLGLA